MLDETSTMPWQTIAAVIIMISAVVRPVSAAGERHWYVGVGLGNSDVERQGFDDDRNMKAFVGYNFSEKFALEGGFIDAGEFAAKQLPGASINVDGFQFVSVGSLHLTQKFSVLGKAGIYFCNADKTIAGFSESDRGTVLLFGAAVEYDARPAIRGEWERIDFDGGRIDLFFVSVLFRL